MYQGQWTWKMSAGFVPNGMPKPLRMSQERPTGRRRENAQAALLRAEPRDPSGLRGPDHHHKKVNTSKEMYFRRRRPKLPSLTPENSRSRFRRRRSARKRLLSVL